MRGGDADRRSEMEEDGKPSKRRAGAGVRRVVDLCVGQRADGDAFSRWVREASALRGLSCEVLHEDVVEAAHAAVCAGRLRVGFLLDLTARWWHFDDPYVQLCYAVKDAGGLVIGDPDTAMMADHKAVTHHRLVRAGIPVPPTLVLRRWMPDREPTREERKLLGDRVVIKPARGWGCQGVVMDARAELSEIARARDYDRTDDYLIQKQVDYVRLVDDLGVERPAWWRVLYVFGEIIPCWWSPEDGYYRLVSLREMWTHELLPLARLAGEIARITGMQFFSTEICLAAERAAPDALYQAGGRPFYVIDYVNDQCDLRVQSVDPAGPPDEVVQHLAERFAELAWRHRQGLPLDGHRSLWLRRASDGDPTI